MFAALVMVVRASDVILGAHNAGINRAGLGGGGLWWGKDSFAVFNLNHYHDIPTLLDMGVRMFELDVYWSLKDDGSPNTLGRLHNVLEGVGLSPGMVAATSAVVELIGLPTRREFAAGPRRPIIAHSVPALGFSYLEDVLISMSEWVNASTFNSGEAVYLRLNRGSGPGAHFEAADDATLAALVGSALDGSRGTFLGYATPSWTSSPAGVNTWLSTRIDDVPHDNGLSRSGPVAGSRYYSSQDNTYETIVAVLGDHPLYVVASDFWTTAQIADVTAAAATDSPAV